MYMTGIPNTCFSYLMVYPNQIKTTNEDSVEYQITDKGNVFEIFG